MIARILDAIWDHLRIELVGVAAGVCVLFLRRLLTKKTTNEGVSMDKQIGIGTEGKVDIKLANGKLYLIGKYDGAQADAELSVGIEVDMFIDQLKAKIPGQIDDAILEVLKAALKVL
mgnify:CR=1 FL=1